MMPATPADRALLDRLRTILATGTEAQALEAIAEHRERNA